MKKIIFLICIALLLTSKTFAENWVCQDSGKLVLLQGDCFKMGLCSGFNNTGILPNCIEATESEWLNAKLPNKKLNDSALIGLRIEDMSQAEIDLRDQTFENERNQEQAVRLQFIDNKLDNVDMNITLTKIDNRIDSIGNLNDAKIFLKRLVRAIISLQSN